MATQQFAPVALVTEGDNDVRDFAATILEETDLAVAEAASLDDARGYLDEHASDLALVFLAIGEPDLRDGINLAHDIADDWPWIKLLVTSDEPGFRRSYLARTAKYLPKPWRALDLLMEAERAVMSRLPAHPAGFQPVALDTTAPAARHRTAGTRRGG